MDIDIALTLVQKSVRVYTLSRILDHYKLNYEQYLFCLITKGNDFVPTTLVSQAVVGKNHGYQFRGLFVDVKRKMPSDKREDFALLYEKCNNNRRKLNAHTVFIYYRSYG